MDINKIICGDNRNVLKMLPDGVIQTVITSPPYWGLRDYQLEPTVWGGDDGCDHEWGTLLPAKKANQVPQTKCNDSAVKEGQRSLSGSFCVKCLARLFGFGADSRVIC